MRGVCLGKETFLYLPHDPTFPRTEIAPALPLSLQAGGYYDAYLTGGSGGQDFTSLLGELNAYTFTALIDVALASSIPGGRVDIQGLLTMMLYTETYLKVCREKHNDQYGKMASSQLDSILLLWERANFALGLAERSLGINDEQMQGFAQENLQEIQIIRQKASPILTVAHGISHGAGLSIRRQPENQRVAAGSTVVFSAEIETQSVAYQWFFNGRTMFGATNHLLTIPSIASSDAGNYSVRIYAPRMFIISAEAVLEVIQPPLTITRQPEDQRLVKGSTALFSVATAGIEAVRYEWFFNGQPITGATNILLTITNVANIDVGTYSVRIHAPQMSITSSGAVLEIMTPPIITQQPKSQSGIPATFSVVAVGSPPLTYQWYWNGFVIGKATGPTLSMQFNPGRYEVIVSNTAGSVHSELVTLTLPP